MKFRPFVAFATILAIAALMISGCSKIIPMEQMKMQNAGKSYDSQNYDEALKLYLELLEGNPKTEYVVKAHYKCAEIYKRKENWDEATAHYQKVYELNPTGYLGSKSKSSIAEIRKYSKIVAENDYVYKNIPRTEEGNPRTEEDYQKAAEALRQIAKTYEVLKIYDKAVDYYSKLVEEFPEYERAPQVQFQIGNIYFYKLYDYDAGWPHYMKVINDYPDSYEARDSDRLLKEAKVTLDTIKMDMDDVDKYTSKTAIEYEKADRRVDQGEKYGVFADRVAQDYTNIAKGWIDLRNYPNAIATYKELAQELPMVKGEAAMARYRVGELYQQNGQYQEAIMAYDELFNKSPESSLRNRAIYNQAVSYQAIHEFEKAYEGFKTYLGFPKDDIDKDLYREARQKVRQMEMDQDGDGYMFYQEQEASTSDQDPDAHP